MKSSNKRTIGVITFLAVSVMISIAATKPNSEKITATKHGVSDTGIFKNLQVLPKDITKDSLDKIMDGFKAALGVRCNFCHAFNDGKMDFASDEKEEKGVARYMIKMAAGINATYFNFEKSDRPDTITVVKCITCHHGSPHPGEMANNNEQQGNMQPPPPHDSTGKMPPPQNQ